MATPNPSYLFNRNQNNVPEDRLFARNITLHQRSRHSGMPEYLVHASNCAGTKLYAVNNIHVYANDVKNMVVMVSFEHGHFKTRQNYHVNSVTLPVDSVPLTTLSNLKNDNGVFSVQSGIKNDMQCVDLYIPMGMLNVKKIGTIAKDFADIYDVYEGANGVYFEVNIDTIENNIEEIENNYKSLHQKVNGIEMPMCKQEEFLSNIKELESLAKSYYAEFERVKNIVEEATS